MRTPNGILSPPSRIRRQASRDANAITGIRVADDGTVDDENESRLGDALELIELFEGSRFGRAEGLAEVHFDESRGCSVVTRRKPMQAATRFASAAG